MVWEFLKVTLEIDEDDYENDMHEEYEDIEEEKSETPAPVVHIQNASPTLDPPEHINIDTFHEQSSKVETVKGDYSLKIHEETLGDQSMMKASLSEA